MSEPTLAAWLADQEIWPPARLLRVARLLVDKLDADRGTASLEKELSSLSLNLATTYEEISLLYHLTQNLKLSSRAEELGQLALEWLADVLPVESLALQLVTVSRSDDGAAADAPSRCCSRMARRRSIATDFCGWSRTWKSSSTTGRRSSTSR